MASHDLMREAQDPSTTAARLAELAQADRALWPAIAVHPAAYPGLLEWLGQQGDPTVSAVLALRSGSPAATSTPTEVIPHVQPTEQPTAGQPTAEQPVAEEAAAQQPVSPVAEPVVPSQSYQPTQSYQPVQPTQSYQPVEPTQTFQPVYAAPGDPSYGSVPPGGSAPTPSEPGGDGQDPSKKNVWVLAALIAAAILLIGAAVFGATKVFGGDDDDKEEATSSQTEDVDETPTSEPEPTDEPTADAPSFDADDDSGSDNGFCTDYKELQDETLDSMRDASGGTPDIAKLTESFGELSNAYSDLADEAPSELRSDIEVMADYFDTFKDPESINPSDLSGKIEDFTEASQKVSQYYAQECI